MEPLQANLDFVDKNTLRIRVHREVELLSTRDVFHCLSTDTRFRDFFTRTLCDCEFEAFFFETPPATTNTLSSPFECVLVNAPALARVSPDAAPFSVNFSARPDAQILAFPNLGGDATLIVPAPKGPPRSYTHLAAFLRSALREQVDDFWRVVGSEMSARVSAVPVWLSTAGMGVSWLHLRLDSRPKYYRHVPYANRPAT